MMRSKTAAAPFALWMTLFTVIPLGIVLWFAFTDEQGQFTLSNLSSIGEYAGTFGLSSHKAEGLAAELLQGRL